MMGTRTLFVISYEYQLTHSLLEAMEDWDIISHLYLTCFVEYEKLRENNSDENGDTVV